MIADFSLDGIDKIRSHLVANPIESNFSVRRLVFEKVEFENLPSILGHDCTVENHR